MILLFILMLQLLKMTSFLKINMTENAKIQLLAHMTSLCPGMFETTVDSFSLEHPLSRTFLYLELKSQSLLCSL